MAINIRFNQIKAHTISGGGIFVGQNIALGWDSFTKSNTGISNGNFSPITNTIVIVDDRDVIDAPVIDADRPIANVAELPGVNPFPEKHRIVKKESEGGNHQLFIQQDGKQVYPKPKDGAKESDAKDEKPEKSYRKKDDDEKKDHQKKDHLKKHEDPDPSTPAEVRKIRSRHFADYNKDKNRPRKITFQ